MTNPGHNEPEKSAEDGAKHIPDKKNTLTVAKAVEETGFLLDRTLKNAPPPVSEMTSHLAMARGKGIRTVLLLNCAADADGLVSDEAVGAAAAIELFHLATLVHDDIIDDADLRRGIPTVHNKFGKRDAVICGDYLLCLAMYVMTPSFSGESISKNAQLVPDFTRALGRTCLGELNQHKNNRNLDLSVLQYLRIIRGKTSALFYVSAYAGAVIGGSTRKEAAAIAGIGRYLGMIFQIVDDLKDYEFSKELAQKPVNSDISEGVVTLPLIFAMRSSPELKTLAVEAFDSLDAAKRLKQNVADRKGLDASRKLATRYFDKAVKLVDKLDNSRKREALMVLLNKALGASTAF